MFLAYTLTVSIDSEQGQYAYIASHFRESISLKKDNKFLYTANFNFSQYETEGSYYILNDSLLLNSYPQKDRIIVNEYNKGNIKKTKFEVTDKRNNYFTYNLYLTLDDNTKIFAKDQWQTSKFNNLRIKSFYIIDSNGMKSPNYIIKGTATNNFKIQFESSRVFENESWGISKDKITPRGFGGDIQKYTLNKNGNSRLSSFKMITYAHASICSCTLTIK